MAKKQGPQATIDPVELAKPGPHPHEAADAAFLNGSDTSLPTAPDEDDEDGDEEAHQVVRPWV